MLLVKSITPLPNVNPVKAQKIKINTISPRINSTKFMSYSSRGLQELL